MKALVAHPDPAPNGFDFTDPKELLQFGGACGRARRGQDCGCQRSFIGIHTKKATTLAVVIELPECFNWKTPPDEDLQAALEVAEQLEPGTQVRPKFDFDAQEWTWDVVGH